MGLKYQQGGGGFPKDAAKAVSWFTAAARNGQSVGNYLVGVCYLGNGCKLDEAAAQPFLLAAAADHWRGAELAIGVIYRKRGDTQSAKKWLLAAAEHGDPNAQFEIAGILANEPEPESKAQARQWYMKAALNGNGAAAVNAGDMYWHGVGGPVDLREAFRWTERAALMSIPQGWINLVAYYRSVEKNPVEAARWSRVLADLHFGVAAPASGPVQRSISFNYQNNPADRHILVQLGDSRWEERLPQGSYRFTAVGSASVDGNHGTVLRKEDRSLYLFVPDAGSRATTVPGSASARKVSTVPGLCSRTLWRTNETWFGASASALMLLRANHP